MTSGAWVAGLACLLSAFLAGMIARRRRTHAPVAVAFALNMVLAFWPEGLMPRAQMLLLLGAQAATMAAYAETWGLSVRREAWVIVVGLMSAAVPVVLWVPFPALWWAALWKGAMLLSCSMAISLLSCARLPHTSTEYVCCMLMAGDAAALALREYAPNALPWQCGAQAGLCAIVQALSFWLEPKRPGLGGL